MRCSGWRFGQRRKNSFNLFGKSRDRRKGTREKCGKRKWGRRRGAFEASSMVWSAPFFFVKEKGIFKNKIGNWRHFMAVQGHSSSPHCHTSTCSCSVEDPTQCSYVMLAKSQSWPQSSKHFCSVAGSTPVANYPQQIASVCSGGTERRVVSTWHERGKPSQETELTTYIFFFLLVECAAGWLHWIAYLLLIDYFFIDTRVNTTERSRQAQMSGKMEKWRVI